MTLEEVSYFTMLDDYSRSRHRCFVAEMFLNNGTRDYTVCFRPMGISEDSPNRYACRYLHIGAEDIRTAEQKQVLPASITEMLDRELPTLPQS